MKIRVLLPALVLIAQASTAGASIFRKRIRKFSIQMPDNWQTALDGESITARPANNSKVLISVFPVSGASNLKDAFSMATKQLSATYGDVKIGKVAEQKQGGITFFGGQGEGEKDGFELTLVVAAFTPDAKRFFGLAWSRDDASGDVYIKDIDQALASIQPFKEVSKPLK